MNPQTEAILSHLADVGKTLDGVRKAEARKAYAAIRNGAAAVPAIIAIQLDEQTETTLLTKIRALLHPIWICPNVGSISKALVDSEILAFVESCTPTDEELKDNVYQQSLVETVLPQRPKRKSRTSTILPLTSPEPPLTLDPW